MSKLGILIDIYRMCNNVHTLSPRHMQIPTTALPLPAGRAKYLSVKLLLCRAWLGRAALFLTPTTQHNTILHNLLTSGLLHGPALPYHLQGRLSNNGNDPQIGSIFSWIEFMSLDRSMETLQSINSQLIIVIF